MSMMPERISTGSALQPSINLIRSGSSCATGICHPAASAPHSAPLVLKTSLFPEDSCTCSNPVSPIVSLCRVLQICPTVLRANRKAAALRSARNTLFKYSNRLCKSGALGEPSMAGPPSTPLCKSVTDYQYLLLSYEPKPWICFQLPHAPQRPMSSPRSIPSTTSSRFTSPVRPLPV